MAGVGWGLSRCRKSTLLIAAAREVERRGMRSTISPNDQGAALVDTDLVTRDGFAAGEVSGGCFVAASRD